MAVEPLGRGPGAVRLGFRGGDPTRLVQCYATHPLAVQRPLYADPWLPGVPWVFLLTTGAGVLAGDALTVDVAVESGAHALLGTVGATRLHPGRSRQDVRIRLEPAAVLEWLPDPLLPFAGSRFSQTVEVCAAQEALLLAGEVLLTGREAAGERFAFSGLDLSWRLRAPGDDLGRVLERSRLRPARHDLSGSAAMGGHAALGTFRAVGGTVAPAEIVRVLRCALEGQAGVLAGATELPGRAGAIARVLGPSGQAVAAAVHAAWDAVRRLCLGVPAPVLRRNV